MGQRIADRSLSDQTVGEQATVEARPQPRSNSDIARRADAVRSDRIFRGALAHLFEQNVFVPSPYYAAELRQFACTDPGGVQGKIQFHLCQAEEMIDKFLRGMKEDPPTGLDQLPAFLRAEGSPMELVSRHSLAANDGLTLARSDLFISSAPAATSLGDPTFQLPSLKVPRLKFHVDVGVHIIDPMDAERRGVGISIGIGRSK